jgi:hypothetical protein
MGPEAAGREVILALFLQIWLSRRPSPRTIHARLLRDFLNALGPVEQNLKQRTCRKYGNKQIFNGVQSGPTNQGVVGSNPAGRANQNKGLQRCRPFFTTPWFRTRRSRVQKRRRFDLGCVY